MRSRTILAVDDEPFFREEIVTFLSQPAFAAQGWVVESATSGEEALQRLAHERFDVMLLDINMPGLDGMEVLSRMQEQHMLDQTYVIMLSAYGVYENVIASMRGGAKDFVNKSELLDQWVVRIERGFEWQDLQQSKQRAEEELRLLAREIGHDIGGTTYFVLTQRVQVLARLVEGNPEGERSIEIIRQILGRVKRLADDLGHVAVALDVGETWRRDEIDLHRMLERLVQEFCYGHPDVAVVWDLGECIPSIVGSRAQLERTFHNLLTNAGRAMPDGGTLTVRTRCRASAPDDSVAGPWVVIDIEDTGVGIQPGIESKVFRIGFSDWRNGRKGSGLGLFVARRNVENHGGRIELSGAPGEGAVVRVELPSRSKGDASDAPVIHGSITEKGEGG